MGAKWQRIRSILNPRMLKPKHVLSYTNTINEVVTDFTDRVDWLRETSGQGVMVNDLAGELYKFAFEGEREGWRGEVPPSSSLAGLPDAVCPALPVLDFSHCCRPYQSLLSTQVLPMKSQRVSFTCSKHAERYSRFIYCGCSPLTLHFCVGGVKKQNNSQQVKRSVKVFAPGHVHSLSALTSD